MADRINGRQGYASQSVQFARWEKRQSKREQYAWCALYAAITACPILYSLWSSR